VTSLKICSKERDLDGEEEYKDWLARVATAYADNLEHANRIARVHKELLVPT